MPFREIPFLRLYAPLCAGVIVAETLPQSASVILASTLICASMMAVMLFRLFRRAYFSDRLFGVALFVFLLEAGFLLRSLEHNRYVMLNETRQTVTVRLSDYPEKKNASWSLTAKIILAREWDSVSAPEGTLLLRYMEETLPQAWKPGDRLVLSIRPRQVENNGNPCEFNYRRYLEGHGIRQMAFFHEGDISEYIPGTKRNIRELSLIIARRMISTFSDAGLRGERLGLVTALTLGDKDLLDRDRLADFSRSGVMHIMAVSGLHVGMISLALSSILFFLRRRLRVIRALIVVCALWGFAFITGLSPSVLRAVIMFTFLQAGSLTQRPPAAMNSLLASAFLLTALRPAVIFEAGFQLSYLAVVFIVAFYSPLYRLLRFRNPIADRLWQMTALSLVAQAGTFALTVRLFNIFPLLFLLANVVVIPVTFLILMLALITAVLSPIPYITELIATGLDSLAWFVLTFTGITGSMEHGVITSVGLSSGETVLLTAASALLLASVLRIRKITLKPFLAVMIIFAVLNIVKAVEETRRERVIVYNIRGGELRVQQHGRLLIVPSDDGAVPAEVKRHACTRGLKIKVTDTG